MKNIKWNGWTILLAVVLVIIGVRVFAKVFSWLWILGSFVFSVLVWVASVLLLIWVIRFIYNKIRGR